MAVPETLCHPMALARKLLIALWRLVTGGEVPQGVVTYVIHPTSIAVSREHRRAKTESSYGPGPAP
jgi:hypothetical protein